MRKDWGAAVCSETEKHANFPAWPSGESTASFYLDSPLNGMEYLAVSRHHPVADLVVGIVPVGPSPQLAEFLASNGVAPDSEGPPASVQDDMEALAGQLREVDAAFAVDTVAWLAAMQRLAARLGRFVNTWDVEGPYGDFVLPPGVFGPPFTWARLANAPDVCHYPAWTDGSFPSDWLARACSERSAFWHDAVMPVLPLMEGIGDRRPVEVENSFGCLMALGEAAAMMETPVSDRPHFDAISEVQQTVARALRWHQLPLSRLGVAAKPESYQGLERLSRDRGALIEAFRVARRMLTARRDPGEVSNGWMRLRDAGLAFALTDFARAEYTSSGRPIAFDYPRVTEQQRGFTRRDVREAAQEE